MSTTPERVEAAARALWEVWRTSEIAPDWATDVTWDGLLALSKGPPLLHGGQPAERLVEIVHREARAALYAADAIGGGAELVDPETLLDFQWATRRRLHGDAASLDGDWREQGPFLRHCLLGEAREIVRWFAALRRSPAPTLAERTARDHAYLVTCCKPWEFRDGPSPPDDCPLSVVFEAGMAWATSRLPAPAGEVLRDLADAFDHTLFNVPGPSQFAARDAAEKALRSARPAHVSEPEDTGACPVCGCEEVDHRNLWTCRCPAPPAPAGEREQKLRDALGVVYQWFLRECAEPDPTTGEVVEHSAQPAFHALCDAFALCFEPAGKREPTSCPAGERERMREGHLEFIIKWALSVGDPLGEYADQDAGTRLVMSRDILRRAFTTSAPPPSPPSAEVERLRESSAQWHASTTDSPNSARPPSPPAPEQTNDTDENP